MINILIPLAGKSMFFDHSEYNYPKPLVEIYGRSLIEIVIENLSTVCAERQFIFIVNDDDCQKFHLDSVLTLLTDNRCSIFRIRGETKGALCSSLMAIDCIMNDTPLIIANSDQVFDINIGKAIDFFSDHEADAGVFVFKNIHPRWSYVRLENENNIVEAAEKKPISKHAIAGFYFFKHGKYFVQAAMKSILKDNHHNGQFFIAPVYNELVLDNRKLLAYHVENEHYHALYAPEKIKEYKEHLQKRLLVQS